MLFREPLEFHETTLDRSVMTDGDALEAFRLTCEIEALRAAARRGHRVAGQLATVRSELRAIERRYA